MQYKRYLTTERHGKSLKLKKKEIWTRIYAPSTQTGGQGINAEVKGKRKEIRFTADLLEITG